MVGRGSRERRETVILPHIVNYHREKMLYGTSVATYLAWLCASTDLSPDEPYMEVIAAG